MIFLSSFLVLEMMVLSGKSARGEAYLFIEPELTQRQTKVPAFFRRREREVFYVGLACHFSLLPWAITYIWGLRTSAYLVREHDFPMVQLIPLFMATVSLIGIAPIIIVAWMVSWWTSHDFPPSHTTRYRVALNIIGSITVVIACVLSLAFLIARLLGYPYTKWMSIAKPTVFVDLPILMFILGIVPVSVVGIEFLCQRYQGLAKLILIKPPRRELHASVHFKALLNCCCSC